MGEGVRGTGSDKYGEFGVDVCSMGVLRGIGGMEKSRRGGVDVESVEGAARWAAGTSLA